MDELLIDDRKYVSSKRAAKITGYAKDYIGQLCREGRVPARLVGRSWYVLESAITDHRFGPPLVSAGAGTPTGSVSAASKVESEPLPTWEAPRYEAVAPEPLPVSAPSKDEQYEEQEEMATEAAKQPENLTDSWRSWFDQIAEIAPTSEVGAPTASVGEQRRTETEKEGAGEPSVEETQSEEAIDIPIRTVYDLPPRELLPRESAPTEVMEEAERRPAEAQTERPGTVRGTYTFIRAIGLLAAMGALGLAALNSGYFDAQIGSISQASIITGVSTYEK